MRKKSRRERLKLSRVENALCRRAVSVIADYLNGDLSLKDHRRFEAHLTDCDDCAAFFNTYKKTLQAMQTLRYEDMPPELQARALKFVRKQAKHDG